MKTLTIQIESPTQIRHSFYLRFLIVTTFALVFLMIGWPQAASAAVTEITTCPFTISLPGEYELGVDCTVGPGVTAIAINASGVHLNLNGHTISGPFSDASDSSACGAADSFGIAFTGQSNVHIHNGEVTGFRVGISFDVAHYNHVNDVAVTGNCVGIQVLRSNNNHINDNNVSGNRHSGVTFISSPDDLSSSNDNTLVSNEVNNNGGGDGAGNPAVFIDHSDRNVIAFNHIFGTQISTEGSQNQGMRLINSHFTLIFGNKVNGSAGEGIRIDGVVDPHPASTDNVVLFNKALGNLLDLADYNVLPPPPPPPPPCVNLNLWRFNRFDSDNEVPPFYGPGVGCIQ